MTAPIASGTPQATRRAPAFGVVEALCATAGIVLAIIGLAGAERTFDAIADIVIGAAFVCEGWTVIGASRGRVHERGFGWARVAGWIGIVLGILALLHLGPTVLAPVALLVFGAGLTLGMGMASRAFRLAIGLCALVLAILAIIQIDPRTLTLIGLIAVGGALLLTGPLVAWPVGRGVHPAAA